MPDARSMRIRKRVFLSSAKADLANPISSCACLPRARRLSPTIRWNCPRVTARCGRKRLRGWPGSWKRAASVSLRCPSPRRRVWRWSFNSLRGKPYRACRHPSVTGRLLRWRSQPTHALRSLTFALSTHRPPPGFFLPQRHFPTHFSATKAIPNRASIAGHYCYRARPADDISIL